MRKMASVQNSSSYSVGASASSSSRTTTTTTTGATQSRRESRDSWNRFFPVTSRDMFFDDSLFENTRSRFNHKIRSILDDWDEREMEAGDTWMRRSVALEKRLDRKRQIQSFSERQDNQTFSVISEDREYKIILSVGNLRLEDINVRVVGRKEVAVEGRRDHGIMAKLPDQNTLKNFHYQFSLPENTNMDAITSVLSTDGFLIISVPKMVISSVSHISGVSSTSRVTVNNSAINSDSSINCGNESATSMKCQDVSHECNSCGQNSKFQNSANAERREEFEDDFHSNNFGERKIQDKTEENSVEGGSSHTFAPGGSSYCSSSSSSFAAKTLPIRRGETSSTDYCLRTNDGDLLTTLKGFLSKRKTQSVKEADLDSQKELQSYYEKQQTKVQKLYEDHLLCMFAVDVQDFLPDGDISIKSIGKRELEVKCHRSKLETSSKPTNSITERFVLPEDAQPDSAEASVLSSDGLLIIIVRKKDELRKVKEVILPISFEETRDETQRGKESQEMIVGSDDQSCQQHLPSVTNKKTCVNDDRSDGLHHLTSNAAKCVSSLTVDESVTRQNGALNQVLMESGSTKPTQNEEYLTEKIIQTEDVVNNTRDNQLKEIVTITDKRESIQHNDSECNKKENYSQLQDSKLIYERTDDCCGEKETKSRLELVSRGSKVSSEGFDSCEISQDSTNEEKEEIKSSLHRDQESISLSVEEKGLFLEDFYFENMRESLLSAIRGVLLKYSDPSPAEDELTCYRNLKTQGLLLKESEILSLSLEDESNYKFVIDVNDVIEQGGVKVTVLNGRNIRVESEIPVNEFDSESCQHFSKGFSLSGDISIESASSAISSDGFLVIIVPKKILSGNSMDSREDDETTQQMLGQLDDSDLNKKKQTLRTTESWKTRNLDVDDDKERRDSWDHHSTTTSHKQMNNNSLDDGYSKTLGDSTTFSIALDSSDQNISQKVLTENPAKEELDVSKKDSSETVKSQVDDNIKIDNIDASEFLSRQKKETKIDTVTSDHRISIKKAKIAETEEEEEENHSVETQGLRTFHNTEEMDDNTLRGEEDTGKEEHKELMISLSDELETSSNKSCSLGISKVNQVLPLIRSEVDEKTAAVSQFDKSITLLIQERELFAEDGFFESVRKESLEAMKEILTQCGDLPSTGDELTNYRILRSQDVKEEHRLAKSYEDEHQFKIIMDVNAFKLQKKLYVKVTKEKEIIVGFPLEENEGEFEFSKNYNKSFFVTSEIDVESAMCGLSSDGFIAITFAKKDVTVSAEDSSSTSSTGMIQGSKVTAEKISECGIDTLSSTDVRFATRSGSVIGQNCNASLTDEQRPSSTMNHPTNDQSGFSEVELPIECKTSYDNDSLIQDVSSNTSNSSSTGIKFTTANKQVMADPLARKEWDVSEKSSSEQVKSQDDYKKNIDNYNASEYQLLEKETKINTGTSNPHKSFSNPKDEFDEEEYHHLKQQGVRISHTEDMDDNTQWGDMGNEERKNLISLSDELETSSNNSCGRGISKDNEDLALIRSEMDEKTAAVSQFNTCFTLLVQEKGLFGEDCFFEGVRKHTLDAVKEILTQYGDLPSTGDELTSYWVLRSQDMKEEHRLAKSYEDEQEFKIIMDVSEFMEQKKLSVKVTKEKEIIVGFPLEENEDEFDISNSFNKSFIVTDDIDVASAVCGLSSDGFIAITFAKKNVSFSDKDLSEKSLPVQVRSQDTNNDKIDNSNPSEYQSWQKETEIDPVTSDHPNSFGNLKDAESHPANHSQEEQKAVRTSHTEDRDDVTVKQDKGKGENSSSSEQSETSSKYSCVFGISKDNEDLSSLMRSEVDEKTAPVSLFDNGITLLIQERGLFSEDGFFESVRKESLEEMKEILTQCGDLPSTGDELTNYRILRSQDVKEEHRLAKSYEDEHQFKIIMDVSEFMEQKKIYMKVTNDKEIIVGFPLEDNEGEFELSKIFYKSFILSDGIDVESAMCGLSSDGFLALTFTKKDLSFSTEELSVTSVGGMIQGPMVTSEEISECGIKTQTNTDAIVTSNIGSVEDHNFNGSLTVEQKASSQIGNSSYDDLQHSNTASGISFRNPGNTDDVTILPVTKRGLFFQDTFFQDVHLQFQTAMKEALENSSEEETCTDTSVIQSYKCLRKQNPKIENQAFHVQDDQQIFKVVLDVEDLAEESIAVYLVDEKNLVIEGQTDRLEDSSSESSSHTFTRQFSLPDGVDLDSITASLSLDRVLLIESSKKRRNVTHGEDLRSAIELYLFLQRHSNFSS